MSSSAPKTKVEPSLSVVIPFYKDHVYLEDAVRSALNQPIDDLEVIVVNDNPSEETDAFLAEIASRLPLRVVRHEENSGLAAARNTGIDSATKAFVAFLDADDVFVEGGLARNLAVAAEAGSDMTHAPTMIVNVEQLTPELLRRDQLLFTRDVRNGNLATNPEAQWITSSWCSIYRRDFLTGAPVRFDEAQRKYEDRLFVLEAVTKAKTVSFTKLPARIWRRRKGSITTSEKDYGGVAMQCDLIVKCMAVAKRHVAAGGDPMFLQREAFNSIGRLIWDVDFYRFDPAATPELDETRKRFQDAFAGVKLERRMFGDGVSMPIARIGRRMARRRPVSRKAFGETFAHTAAGRWRELHEWRNALDIKPKYWPKSRPAPLDAELILHVGLHKTGSTHLQRVLERDRERLAENGILFPHTGFIGRVDDNQRAAATPGHAALFGALRHRNLRLFETLHEEIRASGCRRVVVSSENLSAPLMESDDRERLFATVREALSIFPKISVVAVVRRPDEYIERYFRELVFLASHWARRSAEQFAFEHAPLLTNLEALLGPWAEIAGGNLRIVSYDEARKTSLEACFYESLGLAAPAPVSEGATYASPRADEVRVARAIVNADTERLLKMRALGAFLRDAETLREGRDRSLLSIGMRRNLIRDFERSSAAFMAAHGAEAPVEAWLDSLAREEEAAAGPAAIDARLIERAIAAMETATEAEAARLTPNIGLRLYRLGKKIMVRFACIP